MLFKVEKYPVIIIGAGIGGLTTAAYLSKLGIPSLLLEQTSSIGGRCATRMINGQRFEIGALYIGGGAFDHLRQTFGIKCQTIPIRCGVIMGAHMVSFPIGWKTLWELKACGVSWIEMLRFTYRCRQILSDPSTFERYESVGGLLEKLTTSEILRRLINATFGGTGTDPYRLPSRYLDKENPAVRYRTLNPEYLPEGNGKIASMLFDLAQRNGKVVFRVKVNEIKVKDRYALCVETDQGEYSSDVVVSNAGLRSTILNLIDSEHWQKDYYFKINELPETLKVVNVFLTFSRSFGIPPGFAVFAECNDLSQGFRTLEKGSFPRQSIYALHIPSNVEPDSKGDHRATLQFYYPRGQRITLQSLEEQVHRIIHDDLGKFFEGFSKAITNYTVYDPVRYEQEFGFSPNVFGVSPDLSYPRFQIETPITNLFCVGDSVAPDGPCVPQAMQSGLNCARMIATRLGVGFQSY
ncbi:hypothetical protein ES705_11589 [subsurface metagenome]